MPIIVCGINHKTASIALREKIFFASEKLALYLQDLLSSGVATEAVLLSTCNRSELYCEAEESSKVVEWFCNFQAGVQDAIYIYQGQKAVEHLMKVACGLDSMVLGEPEILGQVKSAFSESCTAGAVGHLFHRLFQQVFAIAKEIRATTAIGACPVSIASTTVTLAKRLLSFSEARLVLLGAGDMIELLLRYLQISPVQQTWIINRNLEKASILATTYGADVASLSELAAVLPKANVLITATGSLEPIIKSSFLKELQQHREEPLYIFDIAVPRDVEAEVALLPMVKLYCIDDLKAIIQENQLSRRHAAEKAEEIIRHKATEFMQQLVSWDQVADTIRAYRKQVEALCEAELNKALRQLFAQHEVSNPVITERILRNFAHGLTNKLLHVPSVQLRQAGFEGRLDLLRLAKELLVLPELDSKAV
jgi:glutamyl-tRNA reductase